MAAAIPLAITAFSAFDSYKTNRNAEKLAKTQSSQQIPGQEGTANAPAGETEADIMRKRKMAGAAGKTSTPGTLLSGAAKPPAAYKTLLGQ